MTAFKGLGPALVELRRQRGKLAREVAEKAGITRPMLSSYENENVEPSVSTLGKILDALEVGPSDLERALWRARGVGRRSGEAGRRVRFGPEERELMADALERLSDVLYRIVVPVLRGEAGEPEPEGEPGDGPADHREGRVRPRFEEISKT